MIVVFDSNVWLSELGLRSAAASAAKFFLKHKGARLAVPEVVRLEVQNNLRSRLTECIQAIEKNHSQLLVAFGKLREVVLPTRAEVEAMIEELFESVGVEKLEIPFSLESAHSSFLKTIAKEPPSDRNQQFKDGVIWADCLSLLASDSVILVTDDKAFYQGHDLTKGLTQSLEAEAAKFPNQLQVVPSLSRLLKTIQTAVKLDEDALADAFLFQFKDSIFGIVERAGFDLGNRQPLTYSLFATEKPDVLFLEFSMSYECTDIRGEGRTDAILFLKGDGSYLPTTATFSDLRTFTQRLKYRSSDGSEQEAANVYVFAGSAVMGHRQVSNVVRYKLSDG